MCWVLIKGVCIFDVVSDKKDVKYYKFLSCYLLCVFVLNKFLIVFYIWVLILFGFVECIKNVEKVLNCGEGNKVSEKVIVYEVM